MKEKKGLGKWEVVHNTNKKSQSQVLPMLPLNQHIVMWYGSHLKHVTLGKYQLTYHVYKHVTKHVTTHMTHHVTNPHPWDHVT